MDAHGSAEQAIVMEPSPSEPPEHWACRHRTHDEQAAIEQRIRLMNRMVCQVCAEHHVDL